MARILLFFVLFVMVQAAHKHHPKFPKAAAASTEVEGSPFRKVPCSAQNENTRNAIIEKSKCGEPKEVFEYLEPQAAHHQISPGAVWVKRCVGLCDYDTYGSKCIPLKKHIKYIPVRIYNVKTNKETCSMYAVVEHLSCGCCAGSADRCAPPKVFDPRKCGCKCNNQNERKICLKRRLTMRWNPSKCSCETRLPVSAKARKS